MPRFMDRSTRTLVTQYFEKDAVDLPTIGKVAEEAKIALERLLDACVEAEANSNSGRTPMVTVHWIRKTITESLES